MNESMVREAEEMLLKAMKSHDIKTLDQLLHDDLLFHIPNGDIITKEMDIQAHQSGGMIIERIEASDYDIRVFQDSAIVSFVLDTKGKMLDRGIEGKFRYLRVWKLFDNKLKVIGGSCIQITE